jgi:hypothetical protein
MSSFQSRAIAIIIFLSSVVGGCSDPSQDPATEEPRVERSGFTANVSGAVNGKVSGAGIVTYLPPKEGDFVTGRNRPGYYVLANNLLPNTQNGRAFIITFRIPDGAQAGNYHLRPPDPLKVGEDFDAQVEIVEGGQSISYHSNTEGTITLDHFSSDPMFPDISNNNGNIKGTFHFVTENLEGEQVVVNGAFDFAPGNEVMTENIKDDVSKKNVSRV